MNQQPAQFKERTHRRISNPMDKICSKLEISIKDMKDSNTLNKSVKTKIQNLIQKDEIKQLQAFLDKKVVSYDAQIGIKSMKWNIVHFAAKNNSQKILKVILTKTYQQNAEKYKELVNSQTTEGYTPLMVSIINSANEAFSLLLEMGGSDTQLKDKKKMTAYDLALNYKNESAIRQLISYESLYRRRGNYPNDEILLKPIDPELYSKPNCCTKAFDCFIDFILCFKTGQEDEAIQIGSDEDGQAVQPNFLKKNLNNNKLMSLLKSNDEPAIDTVPIGNKEIQTKYSIQWKKLTTAVNQKTVLFDCFQPFDICENNLIIANNLIIFQCLSDHTWLVRKIVRQVKKGQVSTLNNSTSNNGAGNTDSPHQYAIEIYLNDELKKMTVDEHIPFLKQRQQPMFLSNNNEMWPQILQKGLAKLYGSYMKLSEINPMTLIENLTGSFTKSFTLQDGICFLKNQQGEFIKQRSLMGALQDFSTKGYVIMLQGREETTLCPKNSPASFKNYCYTILNFYEKGKKRLILVNCPYVLSSWKQKEKSEIMQLKLIKSHYNSHNQMCVWIEESQFAHFFKKIIVSFTEPNMIRTQMKIRYLLQHEVEIQQPPPTNKLMAVISNLTNSAKNIFSSKNIKQTQRRDSMTSNKSSVRNQSQSSCFSIFMRGLKYKLMTKFVFVKFNIENSKNTESFSLAIKDNVSHSTCRIKSFKGWIDGGTKDIILEQANPFCSDLIKIKQKKGEYLCMFEVEFFYLPDLNECSSTSGSFKTSNDRQSSDKDNMYTERPLYKEALQDPQKRVSGDIFKTIKKHELLVICWCEDNVHLEHIEEEFAVIDCMESWRKNSIKNWPFIDKKSNGPQGDSSLKYLVEKFGQKMILLTKSTKELELSFNIQGDKLVRDSVRELVQESQISEVKESKSGEQASQSEFKLEMGLTSDSEHNEFKYVIIWRKEELSTQLDSMVFNLNIKK